ncbi:hypothetical protein N9P01_03395 [Gammaproteobacteria bacterium]|jgi:hypothetical protein|nr:hypothetical protein [Gammaproteobacteria bacterium]MDA9196097.1 hypothetical protein [Gammaproteobacteria bacterium]
MKLLIRKTHKYLSFFISIQLLLWTISGIYFSFNKIELVRGEQYIEVVEKPINLSAINFNIPNSENISIINRLDKEIVIVSTKSSKRYLDKNGNPLDKLSIEEAMKSVEIKTTLLPLEVIEITDRKSGSEFRGRSLPIYKVESKNTKNDDINVYVNIYSGEIMAIRSPQWRVWDLMWGFHIMDWKDRDNINNLLLKVFSILALVSSITGLILFFKLDFK